MNRPIRRRRPAGEPSRILMASSGTKLEFGSWSYSAEALRKAVVARGATLTELDLW